MKFIIGAVLAIIALEVVLATNYCDPNLCRGQKHIACNNNGAFLSACAKDAKIQVISTTIRNNILNKHNEYRQKIASGTFGVYKPAARMATIQWDAELAKLAEYNVKQCAMVHDQCRNTDKFPWAGQNLAYSAWSGSSKSVNDVAMSHLQMWFDEYKDASMTYINKYTNPTNGKVIGHFTQLVQEKATHVGCAILRETSNGFLYQYMACDYAYTNIYNKPVYTTATKAASKCTTGVNPSYKSLCSVSEKFDVKTA